MDDAEAVGKPVEEPVKEPVTEPVKDPLLNKALADIEASVPEKYQRGYDQIMAAGLQAMFSEKTFPMTEDYLKNIKSPEDVPKLVAHGAIKLLSILYNESQGSLSIESSGAAAQALMVHALDYVERQLHIDVTPEMLAATVQLVIQGHLVFLKQATKLSDEDFQKAITPKQPGQPGEPPAPTESPNGSPAGIIQGA